MTLPVNYDETDYRTRRVVREEYARLQGGNCYYCNSPLSDEPRADIKAKKITPSRFPPSMFKHPVHLHHDHETGMTLGAVHAHCNAVLFEYEGE